MRSLLNSSSRLAMLNAGVLGCSIVFAPAADAQTAPAASTTTAAAAPAASAAQSPTNAAAAATPAAAQTGTGAQTASGGTAPPDAQARVEAAAQADPDIIVTGTRISLTDALQTKRISTQIVDSISSEGIGRLPDLNVAEALQRVPGVQINRSALRRQGTVSIRGLTAPFVLTQINGQTLASPFNTSAFPFGTLRSEVFSGIDVVKAQSAASMTGGLAGIVNLKTTSPLDQRNQFSVTSTIRYEEATGAWTPGAAFIFSRQIIPGELAIRVAYGYQKFDFREDSLLINSYFQLAGASTTTTADDIFAPQNVRLSSLRTAGDNHSGSVGLAWRPAPNLTLNATAFIARMTPDSYQSLNQTDALRGYAAGTNPVNTGNPNTSSVTRVEGIGTLLDGGAAGKVWSGVRMTGPQITVDGRQQDEIQKTGAYTFNAQWRPQGWVIEGTVHYTHATIDSQTTGFAVASGRIRPNALLEVETGQGTIGNATYTLTPGSFQFYDFSLPTTVPLASGSFRTVNPLDPNLSSESFSGSYRYFARSDTETAYQLDVTRDLGFFVVKSLQVGGVYRDRKQTLRQAIGTLYNAKITNLTNDVFNYDGFGDTAILNRMGAINVGQLGQLDVRRIQALLTQGGLSTAGAAAASNGLFTQDRFFIHRDGLVQLIDTQSLNGTYDNFQKIWGGYALVNLDYDLGFAHLRGNVGVRYEETSRSTFAQRKTTPFDFTVHNWLPSATLILDIGNQFVIRGASTRTMRRPEVDQFAITRSISTSTTGDRVNISLGAPTLKPFVSDNLDLSFEWYNRPGSSVSLGLFRKLVNGYAAPTNICPADGGGFGFGPFTSVAGVCQTTTATPAQTNADGTFLPVTAGAIVTASVIANQDKFKVQGWEANIQQTFDFLPGPLKYFGGQFNWTHVSFSTNGNFILSELSPNTYNAILYYETPHFGIRAAYVLRAGYQIDLGGAVASAATAFGAASFVRDRSQLDANAFINITKNIQLTVEGFNITNQGIYQYQGFEARSRAYVEYGRTVTFGARFQF